MTYFAITRFLTTPEAIYGVILGLAALLFVLYRLILCICSFLSTSPFLSSRVRPFLLRHVIYARPYWHFLGLGCTSRTHLILMVLYFAGTGICNVVRVDSVQDAGKRAAKLSLINLFPMFLGGGYEFSARLLGVSLHSYGFLHRLFALVALLEALAHVIIVARSRLISWANEMQFYGLLVSFPDIPKVCMNTKINKGRQYVLGFGNLAISEEKGLRSIYYHSYWLRNNDDLRSVATHSVS